MNMKITLDENGISYISQYLRGKNYRTNISEELADLIGLYNGEEVSPEALEGFLIVDGDFQIKRAAIRVINSCMDVCNGYYIGENGWRNGEGQDKIITHNYTFGSYQQTVRGRVRNFDQTLNFTKDHGKVAEVLEAIIDHAKDGTKLNSVSKYGLIGWLIENDFHKDEKILKQFLRGFFKGEEKVQIIDALNEDKEFEKLEIFWKSRAYAVQKKIIDIAPIKDLPFMLSTKDKRLLSLIEKKMESKI